jgi:hypothetical protein
MTQIGFTAESCVVTMGMRDHCFINRLPGVNIKIARTAVQAFIREFDQQWIEMRFIL